MSHTSRSHHSNVNSNIIGRRNVSVSKRDACQRSGFSGSGFGLDSSWLHRFFGDGSDCFNSMLENLIPFIGVWLKMGLWLNLKVALRAHFSSCHRDRSVAVAFGATLEWTSSWSTLQLWIFLLFNDLSLNARLSLLRNSIASCGTRIGMNREGT